MDLENRGVCVMLGLPKNLRRLVVLRHGRSWGNEAARATERGEHELHDRIYEGRHTSGFRLTDEGRQQADIAGVWIRGNFPEGFEMYWTSTYVRAIETACRLNLLGAQWRLTPYLSEKCMGVLHGLNDEERRKKFAQALEMRNVEPYMLRPEGGESLFDVQLRLEMFLRALDPGCNGSVLLVCHGEVMKALRVAMEDISQEQFRREFAERDPLGEVHNCEVIHYEKGSEGVWRVRRIRPHELNPILLDWTDVAPKFYTNEQLQGIIDGYPAHIQ